MLTDPTARVSVSWMLLAQLACMMPHFFYLDVWLTVLALICIFWRLRVHQGKMRLPNRIVRVGFVLACGISLVYQYSGRMSSEAGIALLVLSYSLKLLELRTNRDAYLQIILGYFVVATGFLFDRALWLFFYSILVIVLITTALVSLQHVGGHHTAKLSSLKKSAVLCGQAIPITILLFLFFPRMVPLWSLSLGSSKALPSLSDSMSPSQITDLAGRKELAFRVSFKDQPPAYPDLYWRAMVYSHYDGKEWSAWLNRQEKVSRIEYEGRPYEYTVMLQPTHQKYLVSLDMPKYVYEGGVTNHALVISGNPRKNSSAGNILMGYDYRLESQKEIKEIYSYGVQSFLSYKAGEEIDDKVRQKSLQLPPNLNPRTRALAQQWFDEAQENPQRFIDRILKHFTEEQYFYTLKPVIYKQDAIDEFLFDGKSGYCAHYAGAFVFMLRAAGIPARVVGGYLGGEANWIGNYISVYQYEAHAWAEAWLPGQGWTRFDPTEAVAPERVLDSIQQILEREEAQEGFFSGLNITDSLLKNFEQLTDYVNYVWYQNVVGYNNERQKNLLEKYFFDLPAHFFIILIFSLLAIIAIGLLIYQRRAVAGLSKVDVLYRRFQKYLAQSGVQMFMGETPEQYEGRAIKFVPEVQGNIHRFTQIYMQQQYQPYTHQELSSTQALKQMRKELRVLRAKLILQRNKRNV